MVFDVLKKSPIFRTNPHFLRLQKTSSDVIDTQENRERLRNYARGLETSTQSDGRSLIALLRSQHHGRPALFEALSSINIHEELSMN